MKVGTWLSSLAVFPVALVLSGCGRSPNTVDEVIERNTRAMGGRQAIEAVHSVAIDLRIVDPDFAVDGSYRATRPGKMRIDVNAEGKHVFTEAFDGHRGWQWKGEGTTTIDESAKATAALRHGVELPGHLYGLHELRQRGHRIDLIGREKIEKLIATRFNSRWMMAMSQLSMSIRSRGSLRTAVMCGLCTLISIRRRRRSSSACPISGRLPVSGFPLPTRKPI